MKTRRMGLLTALLLTAALFAALPGLMRTLLARPATRADDSLRPPRLQTVTVWLLPGEVDDRRLISAACAAFEKAHPGMRVFLRSAAADDLYAADAVLPDVLLFDTGAIAAPEKALLPLADASAPSGMYNGVCYAVPLWLSPNVLSLPPAWLAQPTPAPGSLLGAGVQPQPSPAADSLPWAEIAQGLQRPQGVALQQLLCLCPPAGRARLRQCQQGEAQVLSLRAFVQGGGACGVVLAPAVSDRVRMGALCRDGETARTLLAYLQQHTAQLAAGHGFVCPGRSADATDECTRQAIELFASTHTLVNAFAHTREELRQLCLQGFLRGDDPVATLLALR